MTNIGDIVGGKYELTDVLGQGGMGRVWKANDTHLRREVALKEILPPETGDEDAREQYLYLRGRFKREALAAAKISHPGIVPVHELIEHRGNPMIVMSYVPGGSLAALVTQQGRLAPERAANIGAQIADALQAAHDQEIVHRDVKPDNILLAGDRALLTDFGIASMHGATAMTVSGQLIGTRPYMSPEQANGQKLTGKSDVWSLAVALYRCVEGELPFNAPGWAVLAQIIDQPYRPLRTIGAWTSGIAVFLCAALEKDPAQRPDAGDAAALLRAVTAPVERPMPIPADPPDVVLQEAQEREQAARKNPAQGMDVQTQREVAYRLRVQQDEQDALRRREEAKKEQEEREPAAQPKAPRRALLRPLLLMAAALVGLGTVAALIPLLHTGSSGSAQFTGAGPSVGTCNPPNGYIGCPVTEAFTNSGTKTGLAIVTFTLHASVGGPGVGTCTATIPTTPPGYINTAMCTVYIDSSRAPGRVSVTSQVSPFG